MLHRSASSRLLSNLLSHEKEFTKSLHSTLDVGQSSLASFSAYAAASPPPASRTIAAVAGALIGAQDALRTYALAVEEWCELLRMLKELEDEVGNIIRDREILVDRLIKASKSKDTKRRSLVSSGSSGSPTTSMFASSSSAALEQLAFNNSKLTAAQNELQACETHLAEREIELTKMRQTVVVKGLKGRCMALKECGWKWEELAKDALKALEGLSWGQGNGEHAPDFHDPSRRSSTISSSLAPSQSASQINHPDYSSQGHSSISSPLNMLLASPEARPEADILNDPTQYRLSLPPAHAFTDEDQHHYVPSRIEHLPSPVPEDDELGGSSVDEESDERMYEVHENTPFSTPDKNANVNNKPAPARTSGSAIHLPHFRHSKKPTTDESSPVPASISAPLPVLPSSLTPAQAQKIDPYGNLTGGLNRGYNTADDYLDGSPRQKKWSSFFSGLFHKRGRAMSMSAASPYSSDRPSTSGGGGWRTRTDKNLKMVGRTDDSSDDEDHDARRLPGASTQASAPAPIIDYAALRQKSIIEHKTLPNPGTPGSTTDKDKDRDNMSTKSSPAKKGTPGRKKLRKTAEATRKRNASAVDVSSSTLTPESGVSSRAVKAGVKTVTSTITEQARSSVPEMPKPAIPSHIRAMQTNGGGGEISSASVSRSNTLTSNASSNAPSKRAASLDVPPSQVKSFKRGSGTWSDGGRIGGIGTSSTVTVTASGTTATPPRAGHPHPHPHPHPHARTVSQGSGVAALAMNRGQASLMSIVEGVTQQNRTGWSKMNPDSLLFEAKAPPRAVATTATALDSSSPPAALDYVLPPPRVSSANSADDHSPSRVVGKRRILTSATAQNPDLRRLSTISASSSEPSLPLKDTTFNTTPTPTYTRSRLPTAPAAKAPLRSALRHRERSASPNSTASTPRSASPVRFVGQNGVVVGAGAGNPNSGVNSSPMHATPQPKASSSQPSTQINNADVDKDNDDDTGSMTSAYETGREDFDLDDEKDAAEQPPTPPPHDPLPSPLFTMQSLPLPNSLVPGPKADGTQGSSSVSGGTATPPSRRKSVRVSLQPTFSPTPPAVYEEEGGHAPWNPNHPAAHQSQGQGQGQKGSSWRTRAEVTEDVWENSSDENEEYSRAKQMLYSASKKLEKAGHLVGLK